MNRKINQEKIEDFFYNSSKFIIFVPIVIIIGALLIKFTQASKTIGTIVDKSKQITPTVAANKIGIDLKGPYICTYKDDKINLKAYIKNKKISATLIQGTKTDKYLLNGDCVRVNDEKTCGVSFYVSMAEGMLNSNSDGIKTMFNQYSKGRLDFDKAIKSCVKKDFQDSVFK